MVTMVFRLLWFLLVWFPYSPQVHHGLCGSYIVITIVGWEHKFQPTTGGIFQLGLHEMSLDSVDMCRF